ncbi:MAG: MFS transporter, partial [Frankia sp.]|nr:MFS transporter [Frankia sp.]
MTRREINQAFVALLMGLTVTMLSATVVAAALPRIVADLGGGAASYTWVVTATLLMMTATMPIWGKLADLVSKKLLLQLSLVIFVAGSTLAGLAVSAPMLIAARAVQGIGVGGASALSQVTLAVMVAPRERGRYNGYIGSAWALSTAAGPLIGGVVVDAPWLGWRGCFFVCLPLAIAAFAVLQRTLRLPVEHRPVKIDYLGAVFIVTGVSLVLLWLSLGDTLLGWFTGRGIAVLAGGVALLALAVLVERRAAEPIVPLRLFRNRTVTLAIVASVVTGTTSFGVTLLFSQYFQLGRGQSPTASGLLTVPMVGCLAIAGELAGRSISRTGRWKRLIVAGGVVLCCGLTALSLVTVSTPLPLVGVFLGLTGVGVGMTQQNLILAAQNSVDVHDLGVASSAVGFFRSLGGTAGVSALGAAFASHTGHLVSGGLAAAGLPPDSLGAHGDRIPKLSALPEPVAAVVSHAYGDALGYAFRFAVPLGVLAFVAILLIRETRLRTAEDMAAARAAAQAQRTTPPAAGTGQPTAVPPRLPDQLTPDHLA